MIDYPIEKCKSCKKYDNINHKMKNKLRCMFYCEDYLEDQAKKILQYNRAVSGDEFDTEIIYEHGKKVYGSGWKEESEEK